MRHRISNGENHSNEAALASRTGSRKKVKKILKDQDNPSKQVCSPWRMWLKEVSSH